MTTNFEKRVYCDYRIGYYKADVTNGITFYSDMLEVEDRVFTGDLERELRTLGQDEEIIFFFDFGDDVTLEQLLTYGVN